MKHESMYIREIKKLVAKNLNHIKKPRIRKRGMVNSQAFALAVGMKKEGVSYKFGLGENKNIVGVSFDSE